MAEESLQKIIKRSKNDTDFFNTKICESILDLEYSTVIGRILQLEVKHKLSILSKCYFALNNDQSRKNVSFRICAVRALVALLPLSLQTIGDLLNRRQSRLDYEVHFTMFCYLDWVQEMPEAQSLSKSILTMAEKYLINVSRKTARAVWMVGDMLGDHWNVQEAFPVLITTAKTSRYATGRQGSILGLEQILKRVPKDSDIHKHLLNTLHEIVILDNSKYVKEDARIVLESWQEKTM